MWKCSECGTEFEGNFCGKCGSSRVENDTLQPTVEEVSSEPLIGWSTPTEQSTPEEGIGQQSIADEGINQQEMPANDDQPPVAEESGKKGCIIAVIVFAAIIALLVAVIYFAVSLIINEIRDNQEERRTQIEESTETGTIQVVLEEVETEIDEWASPFHYDVWDSSEMVQIELNGITLDVPVPPHTTVEESTNDAAFFVGEDLDEHWISIEIILRNTMEGDFGEYFAWESEFNLEWHSGWAEILDKQEVEGRNVGLLITHWDAEWMEGLTFTKISQYRGAILLTEIRIDSAKGQEELFEAFGFMDAFGEIMRSFLEDTIEEDTEAVWEHIELNSPENTVIGFLGGVRDSDSERMLEGMMENLHGGYVSEIVVGDFFGFLNSWIQHLQTPVATFDFQSLEILGFLPPEALNELYLSEGNQTNLANQAERLGVDQVVGRVVIFELGGENWMLVVDVADVDGQWLISGLGGNIGNLLGVSVINRGIIPPQFLDEFIGEIDLEEALISIDGL